LHERPWPQPLTVARRVRSRTHPDGAGRCPRCWLISRACACAVLMPLAAQTRFMVVQHVREGAKSTSTVRWARLLLPRCELLEYSARGDAALPAVGLPGDWLLFPNGPEHSDVVSGPADVPPASAGERPQRLIVLDGTWRQVRRMLAATPNLGRLPRLSVSPRPSGARLRAAPSPRALSTLEAMAGAVARLESPELGQALLRLHDLLVDRVLRARGRPGWGRAA
jgi:DTW domain-containing protein